MPPSKAQDLSREEVHTFRLHIVHHEAYAF